MVKGGQISTIECDLQSFTSVRTACEKLQEVCKEDGVYALINNAGIMAMADEATEDGFDTQMQTNHLSHFLVDEKGLLSPGSTAWNAKTFCLLLAIIIMFGFLMPEDPCSKVRCVKRRAAISLRNAVKLFRCGNIAL